jgi:hypothetical protein
MLNPYATNPMTTATQVQITEATESKGFYTITTAKGKNVQVVFWYGQVFVKQINASARCAAYPGASMGKAFATLADAVETYKNADIKQALRALLCELI